MSFSEAAFRVIAIAAIVSWLWRFIREDLLHRRQRRLPHRDSFRHCERSPYWSGEPWRKR